MERKTLTEWPTSPLRDAVEWWLYVAAPHDDQIPGRFRYDDHGRIVFECEDGTALGADTFEDGERFEPCEAPEPDCRIAALEAEVSALKASAEADADAVSEHAAISALMAADPVLCRYGVREAFEMLKARADEACGEPAPLRLGRGPTAEEFRRHNATGGGWLLQGVGEDMGGWTMEMRPIPEADIPAMVRFVRDAIPLNACRQPCGVGVKV
jgi:hypothetical protein